MAKSTDKSLETIIDLEKKLSEIQDVDVLLEQILTETRRLVNADAGSIYVVEGDMIKIKYGQNDTQLKKLAPGEKLPYLSFSFPISETSISGYVALTGETLNIADAYQIGDDKPYKFNPNTDKTTNYRTSSMLTVPLKRANGTMLGVLQIINAKADDDTVIPFDEDAVLVVEHFAASVIQTLHHAYLSNNMVMRMLKLEEFRDPKETYAHAERVSNFSLEIYDRWAFNHDVPETESERYRDTLKIAAKFHDVGKVGISDVILKKQFPRFTEEERNVMKGHTCIGAQLFDPPQSYLDQMSLDVSLHHHDRWDGGPSGYPGKIDFSTYKIGTPVPDFEPLSGLDIPLAARIVAVADVFDALSHKRCYKEAWDIEDAFNEVQNCSGSHFDPEVVKAFMQVHDRILAIQAAYPDEE